MRVLVVEDEKRLGENIAAALKEAQPIIHRGVRAGVVHSSAASRKISRLNARIKALA